LEHCASTLIHWTMLLRPTLVPSHRIRPKNTLPTHLKGHDGRGNGQDLITMIKISDLLFGLGLIGRHCTENDA
jgi:hypothetical protein